MKAKSIRNARMSNNEGISSIIAIAVVAVVAIVGASLFLTGYFGMGSSAPSYSPYGTKSVHTTSAITSSTTSAVSSPSGVVAVNIVSGAHISTQSQNFVPDTITVVIGINNTVTWKNGDSTMHTVTADNGAFNSGLLNPGSSFSFTFTKSGTYSYHCQIHPFMTGKIIVLSAP
jgi:plastocyanin